MEYDFASTWNIETNVKNFISLEKVKLPHGTVFMGAGPFFRARIIVKVNDKEDPFAKAKKMLDQDLAWFNLNVGPEEEYQMILFANENVVTFKDPRTGQEIINWSLPLFPFMSRKKRENKTLEESIDLTNSLQILSRIEKNALEKADVPLYYFLRSQEESRADRKTYRFLNLMICLEAIVAGKYASTETIRRRVAILVSSVYFDKQKTYDDLKLIYNVRNKLFHGDQVPTIDNEIISRLFGYVRIALQNYILLLNKLDHPEDIRKKLDLFLDPASMADLETMLKIDSE